MRLFSARDGKSAAIAGALMLAMALRPGLALDKPTGAPLVLSSIETEQPVPLATLSPDGKTASCLPVRLHWNPKQDVGPNDDAASFELDIKPDAPGASIFLAQLWNASLASALAWQQPWSGARWKVLDTPASDGSGIDAALAVGMISTSARRLYPKDTVVIGSLNPDGSLGAVSRLVDRIDAAAAAGMKRVVIPSVQRFDTDSSGQVLNIVRHASEKGMQCIPVDDLVEATETVMNDPLPDSTVNGAPPKYSEEVAAYIDGFARREQNELANGLQFAPKESDLASYPLHLAAIWRKVFAESDEAAKAYKAGQLYVAYRLYADANGRMHGANALSQDSAQAAFDVKATLAQSDDLRLQLHQLMNPPSIDKDELESAALVAEMADWAYGIDASLEGAQLVTKQTFSQRSDATSAEQTRARQDILFAIAQAKYLITQADFFQGLLDHIGNNNPMPVDENAAHLLPQLIPAQLAMAQLFTDGILPRAGEMRERLLFDTRLAAYVNVLRETKAAWDSRQRRRELEQESGADDQTATPTTTNDATKPTDSNSTANATKPNSAANSSGPVEFDPGNTFVPPHTQLGPTTPVKNISDVAACLIWVNHDCEIATLDEKYLWLSGTVDPVTREWHAKDRTKLDTMVQTAEIGARHGIAFAVKAEMDPSVLAMIYERAAHDRTQSDDATALDSLRNFWRCALLGNMCWQLAHTRKAEPVDLGTVAPAAGSGSTSNSTNSATTTNKPTASTTNAVTSSSNSTTTTNAPAQAATTNAPAAPTQTNAEANIPVAPIAKPEDLKPKPAPPPPPAPAPAPTPAPAPAPAQVTTTDNEANIPVAHVAKPEDLNGAGTTSNSAPATTNSAPTPATPVPAQPAAAADTSTNSEANIPVAPVAKPEDYGGAGTSSNSAPPPTNAAPANPAPPQNANPSTSSSDSEANIPVAPVAKPEDYNGGGATNAPPSTNAAPQIGPAPPSGDGSAPSQ